MGLTVAEAFMLIAFALLLLMLLWRFDYEQDNDILEKLKDLSAEERAFLVEILERRDIEDVYAVGGAIGSLGADRQESMAEMVRFAEMYGSLSKERRETLQEFAGPDSLDNIEKVDELFDIASPGFASQIEEAQDRWRLMDEEQVRRIAQAVAELPEDSLRELGNLVSTEDVQDTIEQFAALQELLAERSVIDIREAVEVADEIAKSGHDEIVEKLKELSAEERAFLVEILERRDIEDVYAVGGAIGSLGADRQESMAEMVRFAEMYGSLSKERRETLQEFASPDSLDNIEKVGELFDIASPGFASQIEEARNRWRLMDEEQVRRIAQAVAELPEDSLRELGNLVSTEDVQDTIGQFAALQELLAERSVTDIREAVEIADEVAKSGYSDIDELKARISTSLAEEREKQARLAEDLRASLGRQVEEFGGSIHEDGTIVFPNSVSFSRGSADITRQFAQFLSYACEPWINTLSKSEQPVSEVRFEGHASAEWEGALSEHDAYLRNLRLSQDRAETVLANCLDLIKDRHLREWTKERATAIGYSSARPLLKPDGSPDAASSRRVVFSTSFDREQVIQEIVSAVAD